MAIVYLADLRLFGPRMLIQYILEVVTSIFPIVEPDQKLFMGCQKELGTSGYVLTMEAVDVLHIVMIKQFM